MKKLIIALLFLQIAVASAYAQTDTVTIQFLGTDTITEQDSKTDIVTYELENSKLKMHKRTLTGNGGKTVVKAGLPKLYMGFSPPPSQFEIYYCGKLVKGVYNEYNKINLAISSDGYVAVFGFLRTDNLREHLHLATYTPQGEKISDVEIDKAYQKSFIRVSPQAKYIALHPQRTTDLVVFNQKGEEVFELNTKSGYQNFTFLDNKYLVVCSGFFLVFNLETMENIIKFETINPDIYTLDTHNNYLIGIDQIHIGYDNIAKKDKYSYSLYIISLETGKSISKISLPGKYYTAPRDWQIIIENENQFYLLKNNVKFKYQIIK